MTPMAYVGRAKCGCVRAAVVDLNEHRVETAKAVARYVRSGYVVEHVTVSKAQEMLSLGCPHQQKQEQFNLENDENPLGEVAGA